MKVAMVTPEFLSWGGIGSYTMQLAKHLPPEIEMHLICLNGKENCNLPVHSLGESRDTFFCNGEFQYKLWRSFKKLQERYEFDIIHANHAQMPDILMKIMRTKIPSVVTVHSTIGSQRMGTKNSLVPIRRLEKSERMTYALLPMLSSAERYYLKRCNSMIFVSEYMRSWCIDHFGIGTDAEIIHNGIDTEMFSKRDPSDAICHFPMLDGKENIVLFSGRMIALKGIETALMANRELKDHATFVFAGNGDIGNWKEFSSKAGIDEMHCVFLGPVAYNEMPYLYSLASVFILPSFSESFPLTVLEAMSCELPVIASDVGGMREIVDDMHDAVLINAGNVMDLVNSIGSIIDDDKFAHKLGDNARVKILKKFSAEKMAAETARTYLKTVEQFK